MIGKITSLAAAGALLAATGCTPLHTGPASSGNPPEVWWLHEMDVSGILQEWGAASVNATMHGDPLIIAGTIHEHGIATHAHSEMVVDLQGNGIRFIGYGGVHDGTVEGATIQFEVWGDRDQIAITEILRLGDEPARLDVHLEGIDTLRLLVTDGGDSNYYDHANWVESRIEMKPGSPPPVVLHMDATAPEIATGDGPGPAIHGPRVVGGTPGRDFHFRIPATGEAPLAFAVEGLPPSLHLDGNVIRGLVPDEGVHEMTVVVRNGLGEARRNLRLDAGEGRLALTPPMGWNSWNIWATKVTDEHVRATVDGLVESGLADKGYAFITIDDAWSAGRDEEGNILANEKFPDMKALGDYIHAHGLKFGIYSSPGPETCAGYEASYEHEFQDAALWAEWGVDYLKYDWCSYGQFVPYGSPREAYIEPYRKIREALEASGRDIVLSLCQYGQADVWEWGAETGGNLWRTGIDLFDAWPLIHHMAMAVNGIAEHAGPGHWNDPDMLVVGMVGWGHTPRSTRLNRNEQLTHLSLWSLLAAPLMIGADVNDMDDWTTALLGNTEVIDVNQDTLGIQGTLVSHDTRMNTQVWAKPLADGSMAVGLLNLDFFVQDVTVDWGVIGMPERLLVRDLWKRQDAGTYTNSFTAAVPPHGMMLLKVQDAGAGG